MPSLPGIFPPLALWLLLIPAPSIAKAIQQGTSNQSHTISVAQRLTGLGQNIAAAGNAELASQLFERAVKTAQTIEDTSSKIEVLSTIALKLGEVGQTQRSKQLFEQAVQLTKQKNENFSLYDQDPALRDVAIKVAQAGFTERAFQLTKIIASNYRQAEALNAIAPILAAKEQLEPAKETLLKALEKARGITGDYAYESNGSCGNDKFDVMAKIAANLSLLNQLDRALQVAKSIDNCSSANGDSGQDYHTWAFLGILAHTANTNQVKQTWASVQTTKDAEIWSAIAVKLTELGETDLALSVASNLSTQIPSITKIDSGSAFREFGAKENALSNIAIKLAEVGKFQPAQQVAKMINEPTEEDEKVNEESNVIIKPSIKALTLVEISRKLAKAKQVEPALQIAKSIPDEEAKALALMAIAQDLQKTGQGAQAKELLSRNLRLPEIPQTNDFNANQSIIRMAAALVPAGQVEQALQIAQSLKDDSNKQEVLTKISTQLVESGQVDRAWQIANTLTLPGLKEEAFIKIASKLIELGQLDRALQVAQLLEDDAKTNMLANITDSLTKLGQTQQALQIAETLPSKELKASAIANIAAKLTR